MNIIGEQIQQLRKQQGITQIELANAVGVTTQAVSKWENGGTPDALLLSAIADFFQVKIDCLFGRASENEVMLPTYVYQQIHKLPSHERSKMTYDVCLSLMSANSAEEDISTIMDSLKLYEGEEFKIAYQVITDALISCSSLMKQSQYCYFFPEPANGYITSFLPLAEYRELFNFMGREHVLSIMIAIYELEMMKGFTVDLLAKKCNLDAEIINGILVEMVERKWIEPLLVATIQDEFNAFMMNPYVNFVPFLLMAKEFAHPINFGYAVFNREKPILYHNKKSNDKTIK